MITPANLPLRGGRNVTFLDSIQIEGVSLAEATALMQIRLYPDAPGSALIDLTETAPGSQGLSISVEETDGVPTSTITIQIARTAMQALPPPPEAGGDTELAYDIVVTGGAFPEAIWFKGSFIVEGSVTR